MKKKNWKDKLKGGRADKMKPSDFAISSIKEGQSHEKEHTSNPQVQTEIAMDHLAEDPSYYRKLRRMHKIPIRKAQESASFDQEKRDPASPQIIKSDVPELTIGEDKSKTWVADGHQLKEIDHPKTPAGHQAFEVTHPEGHKDIYFAPSVERLWGDLKFARKRKLGKSEFLLFAEGLTKAAIVPFDAKEHHGKKVFIYYNLHNNLWSVRHNGKVLGHTKNISIDNPVFKVSEAGRQRVLRDKAKNVHAGVQGIVNSMPQDPSPEGKVRVSYNPYKAPTFVDSATANPVYSAKAAHLSIEERSVGDKFARIPHVHASDPEAIKPIDKLKSLASQKTLSGDAMKKREDLSKSILPEEKKRLMAKFKSLHPSKSPYTKMLAQRGVAAAQLHNPGQSIQGQETIRAKEAKDLKQKKFHQDNAKMLSTSHLIDSKNIKPNLPKSEDMQKNLPPPGQDILAARGWKLRPDHKNSMLHLNHGSHGTISIKPNPNQRRIKEFPYVAVHNGAMIGRYKSDQHAALGVKNYIQSLGERPNIRMLNPSVPLKRSERSLRDLLKFDAPQSTPVSTPKKEKAAKIINHIKVNDKHTAEVRRKVKAALNQKNTEIKTFLSSTPNPEVHPDFNNYKSFLRKRNLSGDDAAKAAKKGAPAYKWGVDHAKVAMTEAKKLFDQNPDAFRPTLTFGNAKTSPEGIAVFDLPAVKTCPAADSCTDICYADAGQTRNFDKLARYSVNFYASQKPDFADQMDGLIKGLQTYKEGPHDTRDWSKKFRPHGYGDFYNEHYVNNWHEIAKRNPQTEFYAYTKSYAIPRLRDKLFNMADTLPNFLIRQSVGSKNNGALDPNRPMAIIAEDSDEQIQNGSNGGMIYCGDKDSLAADKRNHMILLRAHGSSAKRHSLGKHLLGLPPELHARILNTLKGSQVAKSELMQDDKIDISDHFSQPDETQTHESDRRMFIKQKLTRHLPASFEKLQSLQQLDKTEQPKKYVTVSQNWTAKRFNRQSGKYENPVQKITHLNDLNALHQFHGRPQHQFHDQPVKHWGSETYEVHPDGSLKYLHAIHDTSD